MATVVSIMDRESWIARTDNIVVILPQSKQIIWVPRDLWSTPFNERINAVFRKHSHQGLMKALEESGLKVQHSLCVLPSILARGFAHMTIKVPVANKLTFRYPLARNKPIEEGEKIVSFDAGTAILRGERIHQWIGARYEVGPQGGSDLKRLNRQQILLRRMLEEKFNFNVFRKKTLFNFMKPALNCSSPACFEDLKLIREDWEIKTLNDGKFLHKKIDNKFVLVL